MSIAEPSRIQTATVSAFWCQRHIVVTVDGLGESVTHVVPKPYARIGSHPSSDIVLTGGSIPQRSIYLHAVDRGLHLITLAHSPALESVQNGWVLPEQEVVIGPYRITASLAGEIALPGFIDEDWTAQESAPAPFPRLAVSLDGRRMGSLSVTRRLTSIGRDDPSDVRLSSRSISSIHCVLYREESRLWAIDLTSGNGTYLGGAQIESAEIRMGARLRLGAVTLRYQTDVPIPLRGRHHSEVEDSTVAPPVVASATGTGETAETCDESDSPISSDEGAADPAPSENAGSTIEQAAPAAELESLRAEFAAREAEWARMLQLETNGLLARKRLLEDARSEFVAQLEQLKLERAEWERDRDRQVDQLGGERARLAERESELAGDTDRIRQEAAALAQERASLAAEREEFHLEQVRWRNEREQRASASEADADRVARRQAELQREVERLQREREAFAQQVAQWTDSQQAAWDEHQARQDRLKAAEDALKQAQVELDRRAAAVEARSIDIEHLQAEVKTDQDQLSAESQRSTAELRRQRQDLEKQEQAIASQRAALKSERETWEMEQLEQREEHARQVAELNRLQSLIEAQRASPPSDVALAETATAVAAAPQPQSRRVLRSAPEESARPLNLAHPDARPRSDSDQSQYAPVIDALVAHRRQRTLWFRFKEYLRYRLGLDS